MSGDMELLDPREMAREASAMAEENRPIEPLTEAKVPEDPQAPKTLPGAPSGPEIPAADEVTEPCSDLANAERLVRLYGKDMLYCAKVGGWHVWDGTRFQHSQCGQAERRAKRVVRNLLGEAQARFVEASKANAVAATSGDDDLKKKAGRELARAREFQAWAKSSQGLSRINAMLSLAATEKTISCQHTELDVDPWLLNCSNGTLDLRTGTLRPHRRSDRITRLAPVAYKVDAKCPRWERFLSEIVPDFEVRGFLQRFAGYCLTGVIRQRIVALFYGTGANGKSVYVLTLRAMMGDYASTMAPGLLMSRQNEAHPTEQADLLGVRLAVCSEVRSDRSFDEEATKRLSGGDPIKARRMREDFFEFFPTWKLVLFVNHKPRVRDTTNSIWDRIREVPFEVRIEPDKQDADLKEKLREEMSGILAWAVRGCAIWRDVGLAEPEAVMSATNQYRQEQDQVGQFLGDLCTLDPQAEVLSRLLYESYVRWTESNGERAMSQNSFGRRLADKGVVRRKANGRRVYEGVKLSAMDEVYDREPDKAEEAQARLGLGFSLDDS